MNAETKIEIPQTIVGALAVALPTLGQVAKNKRNPHFKSSYADLAAVIAALAPLADHGVWFRQEPRDTESSVGFETFYIYKDGSELSAGITRIPVDRNNAQGYGSAQTYCRRYALQAAFGLAAEDDDGNAATDAPPQESEKPAPKKKERSMPDDEWSKLVSLTKATGVRAGELLELTGATDLGQLDHDQYAKAVQYLNDKLAEKAKAEAAEKAAAETSEIDEMEVPF